MRSQKLFPGWPRTEILQVSAFHLAIIKYEPLVPGQLQNLLSTGEDAGKSSAGHHCALTDILNLDGCAGGCVIKGLGVIRTFLRWRKVMIVS
jgi:hypothetical protein